MSPEGFSLSSQFTGKSTKTCGCTDLACDLSAFSVGIIHCFFKTIMFQAEVVVVIRHLCFARVVVLVDTLPEHHA